MHEVPSVQIVRANRTHLSAIEACARAAYEKYVMRIGREPAPMMADFAAAIAAGHVRVAVDSERLMGYAVFYPRGDHLHLEILAVFPGCQGCGIGRALIAYVEDEARRLGLDAVDLYTNEKMTENLWLYPRLGYRETGRRSEDGFIPNPIDQNRCAQSRRPMDMMRHG